MRIPGRRWQGNLVLLNNLTANPTQIDHISPVTPFIAIAPRNKGIYPMKEFTQIQLNVGIWALPAGATFVDITMIKFRGFLRPQSGATQDTGSIATGTPRLEFFRDQYTQVDGITGLLDPFPATIRFIGAAGTLVYNGQNYDDAGQSAGNGGGSFSFPITDDYVGFLVESDDDVGAGTYTLSVTLGSN